MQEFEPTFEQEPSYHFPWRQDAEGYYLIFKTEEGEFEARNSNTMMYLYPDNPEASHVWIQLDDDYGMRLFREHVDRVGEGAFSTLCDQLFDHGFELSDEEEPQESDIQAFIASFGREPIQRNPVEQIVSLVLKNFDQAWEYYEPDWREDLD